jgi:hypothetical protein
LIGLDLDEHQLLHSLFGYSLTPFFALSQEDRIMRGVNKAAASDLVPFRIFLLSSWLPNVS